MLWNCPEPVLLIFTVWVWSPFELDDIDVTPFLFSPREIESAYGKNGPWYAILIGKVWVCPPDALTEPAWLWLGNSPTDLCCSFPHIYS